MVDLYVRISSSEYRLATVKEIEGRAHASLSSKFSVPDSVVMGFDRGVEANIIGPTLWVLFQGVRWEGIKGQLDRLCGELSATSFANLAARHAKQLGTSYVSMFHAWPKDTPISERGEDWAQDVLKESLRAGLCVCPKARLRLTRRAQDADTTVVQVPGPEPMRHPSAIVWDAPPSANGL